MKNTLNLLALSALLAGALLAGESKGTNATPTASTQTAAVTTTIDTAQLQKLLSRIDALEAEVKTLKSAPVYAASPTPASNIEAPIIKETWPQVKFTVQGDVNLSASKGTDTAHNSFALGDFDPMVVAKLSDKAQVLGDFAITSDSSSGDGFNIEIERLYAQYDVNDWLNVQAGRVDTSIGYYNNAYHNGTYFQASVDRPSLYDYEDNGGILPVHGTGLTLYGAIPSGSWNLHYVAQVLNGRDYNTARPVFSIQDNNDFKALNVALYVKPEWLEGVQVGGSVYYDRVATPTLPDEGQLITSVYGVYNKSGFQWLTEGVFIRDEANGVQYFTPTGYSMISKKFGKLTPYARLEFIGGQYGDPLLAYIGANHVAWGPTIGVRWDFAPMMALKVEYEHMQENGGIGATDTLTGQWTFRY